MADETNEQYTDAQLADGTKLRFNGQLTPDQVKAKVTEYRAKQSGGAPATTSTSQGEQAPAAQPGAYQSKPGAPVQNVNDEQKKQDAKIAGLRAAIQATSSQLPGGDATVGALQGLAHTGLTISDTLKRVTGGGGPEPSMFRSAIEPTTVPEKLGFGAEQAAEFFVPGGAVSKGTKAVEAGVDALKLGPIAAKTLKLAGAGAVDAAGTAAVTEAQGGDVQTNAGIAALTPTAAAGLGRVAKTLSESGAPALANRVLRPVPTRLENAARFGRNPGQAIADEGIIATSYDDLVGQIGAKKAEVGKGIADKLEAASKGASKPAAGVGPKANVEAGGLVHKGSFGDEVHQLEHPDFPGITAVAKKAALDTPEGARKVMATKLRAFADNPSQVAGQVAQDPAKLRAAADKLEKPAGIDVAPLIHKPIDDAIQDVIDGKIEGGQATINHLEELRQSLTSTRKMVDGKLTVTGPKDLNLSPTATHALKRQIGDNTKWSEDALQQVSNDVKRNIYRGLNDATEKAVPGVKAEQLRYGNLLEAEKAAERESARHAARNPFGLLDAAMATAGAAAAAHGGTEAAIAGGVALPALRHAIQSPLARTAGVQALQNAPKWMSPEALKRLRNVALGASSASQQSSPQ